MSSRKFNDWDTTRTGELYKGSISALQKNGQQTEAFLTEEGIIRASSVEIIIDIIQNKTNNVQLDIFKNIVKEKTKFSTLAH